MAGLLVSAQGFASPEEYAVLMKQLTQLIKQTKTMHNQLKEAVAIKREAERTVSGINTQIGELKATQDLLGKGHWQYGSKFDMPELKRWRDAGEDFDAFLNAGQRAGALGVIAKRLGGEFGTQPTDGVFNAKAQKALYEESVKAALSSGAQSELSYSHVNAINSMLEKLQAGIDNAQSHKALLEIIARAQIENAKINAMRIKTDSASLKLESINLQQTVSDAKWAAEFLKAK